VVGERPEPQAEFRHLTGNLGNDLERLEKEFSMLRDRSSELIQTFRDNLDAQLNSTMRRLTVLSAIFLPLSFITGFYGMNFPGMPTLHWSWTFPIVLTLMVVIAVGSLMYARRRKWL
jgi:magnesium transporter